jgi:hypothetical protein
MKIELITIPDNVAASKRVWVSIVESTSYERSMFCHCLPSRGGLMFSDLLNLLHAHSVGVCVLNLNNAYFITGTESVINNGNCFTVADIPKIIPVQSTDFSSSAVVELDKPETIRAKPVVQGNSIFNGPGATP